MEENLGILKENLEINDVKLVINRLMSFIVLDGKHFVTEEEKASYVKSYLSLFVKIINEPVEDKKLTKAIVMEHIFKDISKYVE